MLLRRAAGTRLNVEITGAFKKIKEDSKIGMAIESIFQRCKPTAGLIKLILNHFLQVETMFIDWNPAIQLVDEAKMFCIASVFCS